jgi:biopolymer transport protein ExbD
MRGMSYLFECPQCGTRRVIAPNAVGRRVRCPACEALVEIVLPDEKEAPPTDALVELEPLQREQTSELAESTLPVISGIAISAPSLQPEWHHAAQPSAERMPGVPVLALADGEEEEAIGFHSRPEEAEMDMTPMVDVTFQLLIFFMVTASFTIQKSIQMPTPRDNEAAAAQTMQDFEEDPDFMTVRIDQYGTYYVTGAMWDDEIECPSEQELFSRLREGRRGGITPGASKVLVIAHGEAIHERVVVALDAGVAAGFDDVQLMSVEDDDHG